MNNPDPRKWSKDPFFPPRAVSPPFYSSFVNSTEKVSEYPEVGHIANIQGYHVSVVTLALPPFLPLSPFLEPKHCPRTATPHQCRITHFKTAAPVYTHITHTGSALQLRAWIRTCDACAKAAGSCGVLGPGATLCLSGCPSPAMLHQHLPRMLDRTQRQSCQRPAPREPRPSHAWWGAVRE